MTSPETGIGDTFFLPERLAGRISDFSDLRNHP